MSHSKSILTASAMLPGVEGVINTLLDQLWELFMGPVIFWPLLADGMYAGISPAANSVASVLSSNAARSGLLSACARTAHSPALSDASRVCCDSG